MSVLWTLDAQTFEVQDVWFGRTLIRCARLALQRGAMLQLCAAGHDACGHVEGRHIIFTLSHFT